MRRDTSPNSYVPNAVELPEHLENRIERRSQTMGGAYRLSYAKPVHFVRGEGLYLYDAEDQRYLDFYNNVVSLGHCHPRVVEAMAKQASVLCTNTRYLTDVVIEYSDRLTALFPSQLSKVIYTCSGSEANDLAMRIARFYTGGRGFIVSEFSYHGTTAAVSALSANLGSSVPLDPTVRTVPAPQSGDDGTVFARHVQSAVDDLLRHGIRPAGLLVDTLFSSDGVHPCSPGFLKQAVENMRAAGGLFIADEVQPGFARTGESMWRFAHHGVVPDLVTLGKPMGNGYPMSGLIAQPDIIAGFGENARYFNTFAGNTVACANGLAVLDVIRDEELLDNSKAMGAYLAAQLRQLTSHRLGEIRSAGLFAGVDVQDEDGLPDPQMAKSIVNAMRDRYVLISATGKLENTLKIRPPLVVKQHHIDEFIQVFADVLADLDGTNP